MDGSVGMIPLLILIGAVSFTGAFIVAFMSERKPAPAPRTTVPAAVRTDTPAPPASALSGTPPPAETGTVSPTPTVVPKPYDVARSYNVSTSGLTTTHRITTVAFDPVYPKPGARQTVTVTIDNADDVTDVTVTMTGDHKTADLKLTKPTGTNPKQTWTGSWALPDTNDYDYSFKIKAIGSSGTHSIDVPFR
jgi:hypothetical protein